MRKINYRIEFEESERLKSNTAGARLVDND